MSKSKSPRHSKELQLQIGDRLKQIRGHYTHSQAAELSGVSEAYIIRIEQGKMNPSIGILHSLAKGYGISLGELFQPWTTTETHEHQMLHAKLRELLASDYDEAIRVNVEAVYLLYVTRKKKTH